MNINGQEEGGGVYLYGDASSDIRVERYGKTRYWAIWVGEELLAVTVYKKGAVAVRDVLCRLLVGMGC